MTEREIICLQDGQSRKEIAEAFSLSVGRVASIRAQAIRKMRHPWRMRLAIELGLSDKIGLTASEVKQAKGKSLNEALSAYRSYYRYKRKDEMEAEEI